MATPEPTLTMVLELVKQLTPRQKLHLIEAIVPELEEPLQQAETQQQPLRALYGLWKDIDISLSAEDSDEARREMWGNFPREDV